MRKLNYITEFPKLSKSNSFIVEGHIFYCKKIDGIYKAWLYPSGMEITRAVMKEKLVSLIESRIHLVHALK